MILAQLKGLDLRWLCSTVYHAKSVCARDNAIAFAKSRIFGWNKAKMEQSVGQKAAEECFGAGATWTSTLTLHGEGFFWGATRVSASSSRNFWKFQAFQGPFKDIPTSKTAFIGSSELSKHFASNRVSQTTSQDRKMNKIRKGAALHDHTLTFARSRCASFVEPIIVITETGDGNRNGDGTAEQRLRAWQIRRGLEGDASKRLLREVEPNAAYIRPPCPGVKTALHRPNAVILKGVPSVPNCVNSNTTDTASASTTSTIKYHNCSGHKSHEHHTSTTTISMSESMMRWGEVSYAFDQCCSMDMDESPDTNVMEFHDDFNTYHTCNLDQITRICQA